MARKPKLNLIAGGAVPGGPMKAGIPAFGGQVPKGDRHGAGQKVPKHDYRSKKAYTGTVAGNGRPSGRKTVPGGGPRGPAGTAFRQVQGRKPSLMTRIGRRLGKLFKRS